MKKLLKKNYVYVKTTYLKKIHMDDSGSKNNKNHPLLTNKEEKKREIEVFLSKELESAIIRLGISKSLDV